MAVLAEGTIERPTQPLPDALLVEGMRTVQVGVHCPAQADAADGNRLLG